MAVAHRSILFLFLLVGCVYATDDSISSGSCTGVGSCASSGSAKEATTLHLNNKEQPRDKTWGAGLIETVLDVDVFVAGGGSAGVAAAVAAARNGAKVFLVNGRGVFGGNSGSEIKVTMVGACGPRAGAKQALKVECREGGIVEEYMLSNAAENTYSVSEFFSLQLLTLVKAEPNIEYYLNTWLTNVTTETTSKGQKKITQAICENQESQRKFIVNAKAFIDATGDGRLGAEAGAEWIQGREGRDQYNESLAPPEPDHETEGSSLIYSTRDVSRAAPFTPPFWAAKFNSSEFRYRSVGTGNGYWWNEISYPYNTITDNENITMELLKDMMGIWDYVKNSGVHPNSKDFMINWFGQVPGKREGRRFVGQYVSSQNDILKVPGSMQAPDLYWDRVAFAGWPFDLHNPKGMRDPDHPPFNHTVTPYMFSTPLRSLISKDLTNLFFAGRLSSFSHIVYGSQRVMKSCAVQGQAAGTAAAYAVTHNINPIDLQSNKRSIWSIQQQLLRDDAYIIGMYNEDPRDHARNASITATSAQDVDGDASNVISGQSRAVVGPKGVAIGQGKNGTNRWISVGLPSSLTLSLKSAAPISQAHLIFDSSMHMKLSNPLPTGDPILKIPDTLVRDYVIEGMDTSTGKWTMLCNVTGNYQRRRVHNLPCPPPKPTPGPAPSPSAVNNTVFAQVCNPTSPTQNWTFDRSTGMVSIANNKGPGRLCLSINSKATAFGGETQAVVATPCEDSENDKWRFNKTAEGTWLQNTKGFACSVRGTNYTCQCAHITACSACHSEQFYPGTAIETWPCHTTSKDIFWNILQVASDDKKGSEDSLSGILMAGGLCMDLDGATADVSDAVTVTSAESLSSQPIQAQEYSNMGSADAPKVSDIRVTVVATNGVANAHINEIRLYDEEGKAPFPQ